MIFDEAAASYHRARPRYPAELFDVLDDAPLGEAVERLREVQGSGWKEVDDAHAELDRLRGGPDEVH